MKDFYWIKIKPKPTTEGTGKLSTIPIDFIPRWEPAEQWQEGNFKQWMVIGCEWEVEALEVGPKCEGRL